MSIEKAKLYSTAIASVSCAAFRAGTCVSVEFYWQDNNGVIWFLVRSANNPENPVAYPEHHLSSFVL